MNSGFFETNNYFIDEKVNILQFENSYKIYNDQGADIGSVVQKISVGQRMVRFFIRNTMLPFLFEIRNKNEGLEATISRGWTLFMSTIIIQDYMGVQIGTIQQKFTFLKPTFKIFNNSEHLIAEISGDWTAWDFLIKDPSGNIIGKITKKWAGVMQEMFTTADKYNVFIDPDYSNKENKIAILACAITIDMVLKENK